MYLSIIGCAEYHKLVMCTFLEEQIERGRSLVKPTVTYKVTNHIVDSKSIN